MAGRKGFGEELLIKQRYSDLSEDYFEKLKGFLNSKDKHDRQFAIKELSKAFVKMIPQKLAGDKDNPLEVIVKGFNYVKPNANSNADNKTST